LYDKHEKLKLSLRHYAVLPAHLVPAFSRRLLAWHVETTGDPLMAPGVSGAGFPAWFRALVMGELLFQLPFFFVATYAFARRLNWIRLPALVYGVHTATTLLPILLELAESPDVPSPAARAKLLAIYAPYLLLPIVCAAWMASSPTPFGKQKMR
jgi:hypothetical protein